MWNKLIPTGIVCIVASVLICRWWCPICPSVVLTPCKCDCPVTVEVEISDGCSPVYASGGSADPLNVDPGDVVIFTNKNADEAELSWTSGSPFYEAFIKIDPGAQYVAVVRLDAGGSAGITYDYSLQCGGGVVGNPQVNVGGGGP